MLDRTVTPPKAHVKACRRKVLTLAGAELLRFDIRPAPDQSERFTMFAPIGTIAIERDMMGALSITEEGGPRNAPLPLSVQRAVRKWLSAARERAA